MADKKWEKVVPVLTETWDFDKNNELEGTFVEVKNNVGPNESNIYHIKTDKEEVAIWGNTVLDGRLKDFQKGQFVKIVYNGESTSEKTGRTYKDFDVYTAQLEDIIEE